MGIFTKQHPSTIYEALEIDLKNYPDDSFVQIDSEENRPTYQKIDCENKFMGIFKELTIICASGTDHKNFLFKCPSYEFNRNVIPVLIEKIYPIYGKDDSGDGLLTKEEKTEIDEGFWIGRNWNSEKYNPACAISYFEEDGLRLTIWT